MASPTVVASKSAIDGLRTVRTAVTLGALGVVYGDIGTSPLYALKEAVKAASAGGAPIPQSVLGVVSLILWSLILIISLKYAILICRADNRGEGGIVALLAVLRARHARPGTWRFAVLSLWQANTTHREKQPSK